MIKATDLAKMTLESIPEKVKKEADKIEDKLVECAKAGKRTYTYCPTGDMYNYVDTIASILKKAGYNYTIYSGSGTTIKIYW